ncbi:MAG: hypothetical protein RL160_1409 [Bacteroidota bacterium]|jgi:uncharacterized protein (DUF983 family)
MCAHDSKKPSWLRAFAGERCPRCRRGKMFRHPIWKLGSLLEMHPNCEVCGLKFERETGFYYGAMYVSYAFTVGTLVSEFLLLTSVLNIQDPDTWFMVILGSLALLLPIFFRYSRVLYLRMAGQINYDYDPETENQ